MFSKFSQKFGQGFSVLFLAGAVLLSCTPKVGEAPPQVEGNSLAGLECVSDVRAVFRKFTQGDATNPEVIAMWECSQNAVKSFKQYVYGSTEDRFQPSEIAKYLEARFLEKDSPPISVELQKQMMHFKRLFIGGSGDYITRAELDTVINLLENFKLWSLRLNPSMKVLVKAWDPMAYNIKASAQIEAFEKASTDTQSVIEEISKLIADNHQSYDINNFPIFFNEFAKFTGSDSSTALIVAKFLPVVKKAKRAIAGGDENQVVNEEWRNFVALGSKGYLQYLRYYYFVETLPEATATSDNISVLTDYFIRSMQDLSQSFEFWIARKPVDIQCDLETEKPSSCITRDEIHATLTELAKAHDSFEYSQNLLLEVMKLKTLFFGGSERSFTSFDFARGGSKFKALQSSLFKVLPYLGIYAQKWDPSKLPRNEAEAQLQAAELSLRKAAAELSELFEGSYDLQSLMALMQEWDRLNAKSIKPRVRKKLAQEKNLGAVIGQYLPLLLKVKNAVFSDTDTVIRKSQWAPFLSLSSRAYGIVLYQSYFLKNEAHGTFAFADGLKSVSDRVSVLLSEVLVINKAHVLTSSQVQQIVQSLTVLDLVPREIQQESLRLLTNVLIERVFWPAELRLKGSPAPGITERSVQNVRREIQIWYETEKYFLQLGRKGLSHSQLKNEVARKLREGSLSAFLKVGLSESSLVLAGNVPKVVDAENRLIISASRRPPYDARSLSQLNLHRAVGRILTRAAINDGTRLAKNQGLNLEEAKAVFNRVRPALVDMAIIDRESKTFIESRFSESNVFSPHSNGDTLSNFEEVTDIVGLIFSGSMINSAFRKNVIASCGVKPKPGQDVSVSEECVYKVYFRRTTEHMASMPQYLKIFRTWHESQWQGFFGHILKAAGHIPNAQSKVTFSTLSLAPHVSQYMEMLYARFDQDQDELINTKEALDAFPSFSGLLAELTKDEKLIRPEDLPALFTYILHYGEPPGGLGDYLMRWLPWKGNPGSWVVAADRQKLAQIFSFIAEKTQAPDKSVLMPDHEVEAIRKDPRTRQRFEEDIYHGG